MLGLVRLVHPAPAVAVIALAAVLAVILAAEDGTVDVTRTVLVTIAVAGSQIATGALNDWADRHRDAVAGRDKPIPRGDVSPPAALAVVAAGLVLQIGASVPLGGAFTVLGLAALASAVAYDLWLSRTPASLLPYLLSFGILPLWIATGMDVPADRVLAAVPLAGAFAAAAHLANTLRDWEADERSGSHALGQVLGREWTRWGATGLSIGVALGVAATLLVAGRVTPVVAAAGGIGLGAIGAGARSEAWLWRGQLVAAVAWTAAWALSTART